MAKLLILDQSFLVRVQVSQLEKIHLSRWFLRFPIVLNVAAPAQFLPEVYGGQAG